LAFGGLGAALGGNPTAAAGADALAFGVGAALGGNPTAAGGADALAFGGFGAALGGNPTAAGGADALAFGDFGAKICDARDGEALASDFELLALGKSRSLNYHSNSLSVFTEKSLVSAHYFLLPWL
jgi:hypothetical protein